MTRPNSRKYTGFGHSRLDVGSQPRPKTASRPMTGKVFHGRKDIITRNNQIFWSPKKNIIDGRSSKYAKSLTREARRGLKSAKPKQFGHFNRYNCHHNKSIGIGSGVKTHQDEKFHNYPVC